MTVGVFALSSAGFNAHAEIVLDGSLGSNGTLAGPDYAITQDLGQTRDSNLFHSFREFNLTSAESATFSAAGNIFLETGLPSTIALSGIP